MAKRWTIIVRRSELVSQEEAFGIRKASAQQHLGEYVTKILLGLGGLHHLGGLCRASRSVEKRDSARVTLSESGLADGVRADGSAKRARPSLSARRKADVICTECVHVCMIVIPLRSVSTGPTR